MLNACETLMLELFQKLKQIGDTAPKDENLFQIGGRGHYENPTTQLLEFFLSSSRCHGFGSKVLDAFLSVAGVECDTSQEYWTWHEVPIDENGSKGRLDLVLESSSWIVVVEDKIRHQAINDFDAYRTWAKNKNKQQTLLILLLVRDEPAPEGWKVVRWLDLILAIRAKLELKQNGAIQGKWPLFLEEFLGNVEIECAGGRMMDDDRYKFALENAGSLYQAKELYDEFLRDICSRWRNDLNAQGCDVRDVKIQSLWQSKKDGGWRCIPIRFFLGNPEMEIVLKVFSTGNFGVNLYPGERVPCSREELELRFCGMFKHIDNESGYLACIVGKANDMSLAGASTYVLQSIARLKSEAPNEGPKT